MRRRATWLLCAGLLACDQTTEPAPAEIERLPPEVATPSEASGADPEAGAPAAEPGSTAPVAAADAEPIGLGDLAPEIRLPSIRGPLVELAELLAGGPVVLVFYRGAW
jgi:hypothetical protein